MYCNDRMAAVQSFEEGNKIVAIKLLKTQKGLPIKGRSRAPRKNHIIKGGIQNESGSQGGNNRRL
jgi:hypothetical protein